MTLGAMSCRYIYQRRREGHISPKQGGGGRHACIIHLLHVDGHHFEVDRRSKCLIVCPLITWFHDYIFQ